MQDLGHSFHSPKYELTISHGDPIHGPGFLKNLLFSQNAILEIHQTGICGFQHLARHPGLQSTPLDAHRKMSMSRESFRLNYGARGELCRKPFENLMNLVSGWIPSRGRSPFMDQARILNRRRCPFMNQARIPYHRRCLFMNQARIPYRRRCLFMNQARIPSRRRCLWINVLSLHQCLVIG